MCRRQSYAARISIPVASLQIEQALPFPPPIGDASAKSAPRQTVLCPKGVPSASDLQRFSEADARLPNPSFLVLQRLGVVGNVVAVLIGKENLGWVFDVLFLRFLLGRDNPLYLALTLSAAESSVDLVTHPDWLVILILRFGGHVFRLGGHDFRLGGHACLL